VKTFLLGIIAAFILVPAAVVAYFALGRAEVRSDLRPSAWETKIMGSAVHRSVRRSAAGISSPAAASNETLIAGGKLYVDGCAGCHGDLFKPVQEDFSGFPPVPQLPHLGTQYSQPELYWIVKHGIRMTGMSAYGPFYSEQQLWSLAAFLHQIKTLPPEVLTGIQKK